MKLQFFFCWMSFFTWMIYKVVWVALSGFKAIQEFFLISSVRKLFLKIFTFTEITPLTPSNFTLKRI